ncbi:hypothetical protein C1646_710491 [Rhizophagus diaphanus]|nr:hypothetical protein C1646_710491 [Rhizophagus diaphanus] [Rhizophagus sp. MUCL 43196]
MVFFNSYIKYGKDRHHPIVFAFRTADIFLIKLFGSVIRLLNLFHKIFGFFMIILVQEQYTTIF